MRLLIVAPGAKPEAVGETRIAYEWVKHLSRRHDVTVLSSYKRTDPPLSGRIPGARIVEWREPPLVGRHERFSSMLNPAYLPFYWKARHWIRAAVATRDQFDIGHQVVPVSVRFPSPFMGSGLPYVVGPVGGSLRSPPAFKEEEDGAPWFTALRALDELRLRHDPFLRRSYQQAACVIGIAGYVRELLSDLDIHAFHLMSDVGIENLPAAATPSGRTRNVRFLFVGRIIRTKGVRDAVRAIALLPRGLARLDIVGDGYDRAACEKLTADLGLGDHVHFHGWVPHEQALAFYPDADAFLFPSYREAGGIVVTEAMSFGLPVITCDRGGPSQMVDDASGVKVPARSPTQYPQALAAAIERLAGDPKLRAELGRSARARVERDALWDKRIDAAEHIYGDIRGSHSLTSS